MEKSYTILSRQLRLTDSQLDLLNRILSGLLPHENYDTDNAAVVKKELMTVLPIEEVYGVYYIFYKMLDNMSLIQQGFGGTITLNRDTFESGIQHYIGNIIRKPEFNAELFFAQLGREINLYDKVQYEEAIDMAFSYALDLYDELFNNAVATSDAAGLLVPLQESLKVSIVERYLNVQGDVVQGAVRIAGQTYSGPDDVITLWRHNINDYQQRFMQTETVSMSEIAGHSYRVYDERRAIMQKNASTPIGYFGFQPVDDVSPISTQDIITVVADEGTGKTKLTVDMMHKLILAGTSVLIICGETSNDKMTIFMLLNHIHYKTQHSFSYQEFLHRELIPHDSIEHLERMNVLIEECIVDFYNNPAYGRMILKQNVAYEDFYDYISNVTTKYGVGMVAIDHVAALRTNGNRTVSGFLDNDKKRIDYLYEYEDILTKEYNLAFWNTVHTQNEVSRDLSKGREVGVRIAGNSSAPTKWATWVLLLRTNAELTKQNLLIIDFKKCRDVKPPSPIVVFRDGRTAQHIFNPALQHLISGEAEDVSTVKIDRLIGVPASEEDELLDADEGLDI